MRLLAFGGTLLGCCLLATSAVAGERTANLVVVDEAGTVLTDVVVYYATEGGDYQTALPVGEGCVLENLGDKVSLQIKHVSGEYVTETRITSDADIMAMIAGDEFRLKVTQIGASPGTVDAVGVNGSNSCSTAQPLSGPIAVAFDTTAATTDGVGDALCLFFGTNQIENDIWYAWTAECTGLVTMDTCTSTNFDTRLAVYADGACPTGGGIIVCNDDFCGLQSGVDFAATNGTTYLVRVGSFSEKGSGTGVLTISDCTVDPTPANDLCENAEPLAVPGMVDGSTVDANPDDWPTCGTSNSGANGVWYSVIGTGNTVTANTCYNPFYDTKLAVFCADCDVFTCVDGNDDFCAFQSEVSWCSQAGAEYLVVVSGFGNDNGPFTLTTLDDGVACAASVSCLPTGACCADGGNCSTLTEEDCLAAGGVYVGDDSSCGQWEVSDCDGAAGDISGVAPDLGLSDDEGVNVGIGFTFDFFGVSHTTVAVCSNGYLTFGADLTDFTNDPIPSPVDPNDMIAPLWDDFSPNIAGSVHATTVGGSPTQVFIAQWNEVPTFGTVTDSSTFQVLLFEEDGHIEFRYGGLSAVLSPTVGVENPSGNDGTDLTGMQSSGGCLRLDLTGVPCAGRIEPYCFGVAPAPCNCGNNGAPGNGCANFMHLAGANLAGNAPGDHASVSDDQVVLAATDMIQLSICLFVQGSQMADGGFGVPFGDGLLCIGGEIVRLGAKLTPLGTASYPGPWDPPVSERGMIRPGGALAHYQVIYRVPTAFSLCGRASYGFNWTNGVLIDWAP